MSITVAGVLRRDWRWFDAILCRFINKKAGANTRFFVCNILNMTSN
jgi:hypothetical protein